MTYEEAIKKLADINARVRAVNAKAPKNSAPVEDIVAWNAARAALSAEARDDGFLRIFDGSFKLNLKAFAA